MRRAVADLNDRDRAIERLLPQVLGGTASTPCVDGETLAAWTEGALRPTEAARVETHVAACARCQAMLGAFVRITPAPVVTESMWQRWRLNWLLPLATAAAAVALWAVIPGTTVRQESQVTLADARRDVPSPGTASTPPPPAAERETAPLAAPSVAQPTASDRPASAPPPQFADQLERQARSDAARPDALAKKKPELDDRATAAEAQQTLPGQRARNETAASTPAQPLQERKTLQESVALVAPAAPASPARDASRPAAAASATPAAPADSAAARPAPAAPAAAGRAARSVGLAATSPIEIATPIASTRWRLLADARVERTTNNGQSWTDVPGVDFNTLRAGAAPSAEVCWIVGHNGRVYLSTDGRRLVRVGFPEPVDLVGVTASDARTATVRTADGRTFATIDGGATWTR